MLTPVGWERETLLCRVDTGATTTDFYEPFYRRFRPRVDAATSVVTRKVGGAGGVRELQVRVLDAQLTVGAATVAKRRFDVFLKPITEDVSDNFLDCNLGHDILDSVRGYVLNFRDMAFVLLQ